MRIALYFINWNDSFYLPFIKEHYGKFCSKIVMYDNYSSDDSYGLAKRLGFETRSFGVRGQLNDQDYLDVKNNCWKEERGKSDYVIVCDADEFIVCPENLKSSAPKVIGFNMISDFLPKIKITEINSGSLSESYSKQAIFNPNEIEEINYVHGCHVNNKTGNITTFENDTCFLYHFRQIGGIDRILNRHKEYRDRMSLFNKKHGMGIHYLHSDEKKIKEWEVLKEGAYKLW